MVQLKIIIRRISPVARRDVHAVGLRLESPAVSVPGMAPVEALMLSPAGKPVAEYVGVPPVSLAVMLNVTWSPSTLVWSLVAEIVIFGFTSRLNV